MHEDDAISRFVRKEKAGHGDPLKIKEDFMVIESMLKSSLPDSFKSIHIENQIAADSDGTVYSTSKIIDLMKSCDHLFGLFTGNGMVPISGYESEDFFFLDADTLKVYLVDVTCAANKFRWYHDRIVPPKQSLLELSEDSWETYTDFFEDRWNTFYGS